MYKTKKLIEVNNLSATILSSMLTKDAKIYPSV